MGNRMMKVFLDYLLPVVLGGLIGGLLVGAFLVWPTAYGARWWEALTAFGTVGAAVGAAYSAWVAIKTLNDDRKNRAELAKQYLITKSGLISEIRSSLDKGGFFMTQDTLRVKDADELTSLIQKLVSLDRAQMNAVSLNFGSNIVRILALARKASESVDRDQLFKLKPGEVALRTQSGLPVFLELLKYKAALTVDAVNDLVDGKEDWDKAL